MRQLSSRDHQPVAKAPASLTRKMIWFVVLWLAGVAVVGSVAYLIRLWIV